MNVCFYIVREDTLSCTRERGNDASPGSGERRSYPRETGIVRNRRRTINQHGFLPGLTFSKDLPPRTSATTSAILRPRGNRIRRDPVRLVLPTNSPSIFSTASEMGAIEPSRSKSLEDRTVLRHVKEENDTDVRTRPRREVRNVTHPVARRTSRTRERDRFPRPERRGPRLGSSLAHVDPTSGPLGQLLADGSEHRRREDGRRGRTRSCFAQSG